jgi:hypothetical protein
MFDRDLAALYQIETKALNLTVKRNLRRFPVDFMFQITKAEFEALRLQIETLEKSDNPLRLQNETSKIWGGTRYLPYAFTEQGVAMLSGVLNSGRATDMNMAIMRAFVEVRKVLLQQNDLKKQMKEIKEKLEEYDTHTAEPNLRCTDSNREKTCWMKKQRNKNGKTEIE